MSQLHSHTAAELAALLQAGEVSSVEVTEAHLDRSDTVDGPIHAYLDQDRQAALAAATQVDERRAAGEDLHSLAGVPIAVKDNYVTRGQVTTAASKMLEGWVPPYDATVVKHLRQAGLPILGKTNLDEFAMGSSTEHSAFGNTANPWDLSRTPGGSGGGSAAALASFQAPLALGSDTGGSIRQPAAATGTVGIKPTYGSISRYGLIALASSLDQPGPCARTVLDTALLHELIGGHDPHDSTSLPDAPTGYSEAARTGASGDMNGLRVAVIKQLGGEGYSEGVRSSFSAMVESLTQAGADVVEVDCPSFDYALAAYYLILPAEASSNLARFDGMRYGLRVEPEQGPITAERVMAATRGAGFGDEVKRRIILGTHALSAGFHDQYYTAAQKVRTLVQRDLAAAFEQADVVISPTSPTTAFPLGSRVDDPFQMYLNDVATIPANLAGIPAISVPSGLSDGLPVGFQILARTRADHLVYRVGAAVEAIASRTEGPVINRVPQVEEISQ